MGQASRYSCPCFCVRGHNAVAHGQLGCRVACLTQPQLHPLSQRWLGFLQDVLKNELWVLPSVLPAKDVFCDRSLLSEDVYPFSRLQNRGDFSAQGKLCRSWDAWCWGVLPAWEWHPCKARSLDSPSLHTKPME